MKKLIEDGIKYINPNIIIIDSLTQYINFSLTDRKLVQGQDFNTILLVK